MSQRNAFLRAADNVLVAHGFVETNNPGDIRVAVADDFALEPLKWAFVGDEWVPHEEPAP